MPPTGTQDKQVTKAVEKELSKPEPKPKPVKKQQPKKKESPAWEMFDDSPSRYAPTH